MPMGPTPRKLLARRRRRMVTSPTRGRESSRLLFLYFRFFFFSLLLALAFSSHCHFFSYSTDRLRQRSCLMGRFLDMLLVHQDGLGLDNRRGGVGQHRCSLPRDS